MKVIQSKNILNNFYDREDCMQFQGTQINI